MVDAVHLCAFNGELPVLETLVGADPTLIHRRIPDDGQQELMDGACDCVRAGGRVRRWDDGTDRPIDRCTPAHQSIHTQRGEGPPMGRTGQANQMHTRPLTTDPYTPPHPNNPHPTGLDTCGCTPIMLAAWQGHEPIVARLLELGADAAAVDAVRCSAVHWACIGGHRGCLTRLLAAGGLPGGRMGNGSTPLCEAAYHGHDGCIEELLRVGGNALDLDAQDNQGNTALHSAASNTSPECIHLLLDAGCDPTVRNRSGHTALTATDSWGFADTECYEHLVAAATEPLRPRMLLKLRSLIRARPTVAAATAALAARGVPADLNGAVVAMAVPAYLAGRVAAGKRPMPVVEADFEPLDLEHGEEAVAVFEAVLGMNGEPGVGDEVFGQLLEMIVPKWDPARKGKRMGSGVFPIS